MLLFLRQMVFSNSEPNGWYMQYIGTDTMANLYLCNPLNYGIAINKLTHGDKNVWESVVNIRALLQPIEITYTE